MPKILGAVVERFKGGGPEPTYTTSAAITAGRLAEITGTTTRRVGPAAAGSLKVVGVAKQGADGAEVPISVASSGVFEITAAGAITAGDAVEAAAAGAVRVLATVDAAGSFNPRAMVGIALTSAADTALCLVLLRIG